MNNICYIDDEPLSHLDSKRQTKSYLWKIMYGRLMKNLNTELINPQSVKKLIFNKYLDNNFTYNAPLPNVVVQKGSNWFLADDENEYYIPLSIGFTNGKIRFDIVLINGEIELRNVECNEKKDILKHNPMLLLKNLKILELCFELLLDHVEKMEEENSK